MIIGARTTRREASMIDTELSARLETTTVDPSGETRSTDMKRSGYGAAIKIEDGNVGGPGIGDVCAVAIRRNVDEVGPSIDANGSDDFILLSVNYADV